MVVAAIGSALGGLVGSRKAAKENARNRDFAREQATTSYRRGKVAIRNTVRDAQAAGISPLTALGAGITTQAPMGNTPASHNTGDSAAAGISNAFAALQEDLLRIQAAKEKAATEGQKLENASKAIGIKQQLTTSSAKRDLRQVDGEFIDPVNLETRVFSKDGKQSTDVPVGPDIDEIISGTGIKLWQWLQKASEPYKKSGEKRVKKIHENQKTLEKKRNTKWLNADKPQYYNRSYNP